MKEPARVWTPRGYQPPMIQHILETPRCGLYVGMGLGKTCSTLTAIDALALAGESQPTLVLAPLRVARDTWSNEAKKWQHLQHLDIVPIIGSLPERLAALRYDAPIYTCNYENLVWLVEHFGESWPFRTVVADESTRLKSYRSRQGGKRTAALAKVAHTKVKRFIQLTGTPAPNGLADLWGSVWFLDAGQRLGRSYRAFSQRWFSKSFDGFGMTPQAHAQEQIQKAISDICLSIEAKDWFDLKAPIVNNIYVDLPVKARKLYRDMEKEMFAEIEGHGIEAFNAAARTQKLLQFANGAAYTDEAGTSGERKWAEIHDVKLQALESIVEEANGMPVLVGYQFKSDLARIMRAFPKAVNLSTESGMKAFRAGKSPMGLAHPASLGHGVDGLQDVTNILALFGHDWNLENYLQLIERIGPTRQLQSGFDRPMFLYHILARDTIDELVMERREGKKEVQQILLEAMKRRK